MVTVMPTPRKKQSSRLAGHVVAQSVDGGLDLVGLECGRRPSSSVAPSSTTVAGAAPTAFSFKIHPATSHFAEGSFRHVKGWHAAKISVNRMLNILKPSQPDRSTG